MGKRGNEMGVSVDGNGSVGGRRGSGGSLVNGGWFIGGNESGDWKKQRK